MPSPSERGHFCLGGRQVDYEIRTTTERGRFTARVWDTGGLDIRVRLVGHPHTLVTQIAERSIRYLLALAAGVYVEPGKAGELWLKDPDD